MDGYDQIFLVGRFLSALFDILTLTLVYYLTLQVFRNQKISLWATFFYAVSVFPIQQAHFFTVDSFTVFFTTLSLLLLLLWVEKQNLLLAFLIGFSFGLTLANKTSIGITLPVFILTIVSSPKIPRKSADLPKYFSVLLPTILVFFFSLVLAFRIFQPYAFDGFLKISPHFLQNITDAHKMITGEIDYPPNIQWAYTQPLIYPLVNIFLWGLGPIISLFSLFGIIYTLAKIKKLKFKTILVLLLFSLTIFTYQGVQLAKYMRYFYPIYPILALFSGQFLYQCINSLRKRTKNPYILYTIYYILLLLVLVWPLAFVSIYSRPHSRITASEWLYKNIPPRAKITSEEWDDPLPLSIPGYSSTSYTQLPLGFYNPESLPKWQKITEQLNQADYIIMSSNRLWDSIPRLPKRYPVTTLYYQLLFQNKLGFKKVAEINSYPTLGVGNLKFKINDSLAEESFTVYDHPKILIFQKENFSEDLLQPLLDPQLINQARQINPRKTNKINFGQLFFQKF